MKLSICIVIVGWVIGLAALPAALAETFDPKAREGVTHYNREEFDQATAKFQASQLEQPDNTDVSYNLANSLYRLGRYEEAVEAYKKALDKNTSSTLKQRSYYNMGNAYYRMGYLEESIDAYKKALELNSGDTDSKFNLEWARKQLEKARQSNRIAPRNKNSLKQPSSSGRVNNTPEPQKSPGKSPKTETKKNNQTAKNQRQEDKHGSSDKSPSSPTPIQEKEAKKEEQAVQDALQEMTQMTPEEAERWLGSLSEDLKNITRRQMQGKMKDVFVDHDKDW